MESVTRRARQFKQPRGGFIKPKEFTSTVLDDGTSLYEEENLSPSLIGMSVDYMTRFVMGAALDEAFKISLLGSTRANEIDNAKKLMNGIKGLDDTSIANSCKLVGYDVCFRAGLIAYRPVQEIVPNKNAISNIRIMIKRSIKFWEIYGPIIKDGFTFEGGYTEIVSSGDGDYLTRDTLWDFKVSKTALQNKQTLQLLMYYLMGCHSIHKEFKSIQRLGIYNPRLNQVSTLGVLNISQSVINDVSRDVIGYT